MKKRKDAKGVIYTERVVEIYVSTRVAHGITTTRQYRLRSQQQVHSRRVHQYISSNTKKELCHREECPGIAVSEVNGWKMPRPRVTNMYCEEYTAVSSKYVFHCNNKLKDSNILCHVKYRNQFCKKHLI